MPPTKKRAKKPPNQADIIKTVVALNTDETKTTANKIQEYLCKKATNNKYVQKNPKLITDLIHDAVAESKIFPFCVDDEIEYRTAKTIDNCDLSLIVYYDGEIPGTTYFHLLKAGWSIEASSDRINSDGISEGITIVEWLSHLHKESKFLNYNFKNFKEKLISLALKRGHITKASSEDKNEEDIRYSVTDRFQEDYKIFRRNRKLALQSIDEEPSFSDNDTSDIKSFIEDNDNSIQSSTSEVNNNEDKLKEFDESSTSNSMKNTKDTSAEDDNSENTKRNESEKNPAMEDEIQICSSLTSKGNKTDQDTSSASTNQPQRVSQRKKFKKTLGPDFVESYDDIMMNANQNFTSSSVCLICNQPYRYIQKFQHPIKCSQCENKAHGTCFKTFISYNANTQWICSICREDSICYMCQTIERKPEFYLSCKTCSTTFHPHCWREKAHGICQKCRSAHSKGSDDQNHNDQNNRVKWTPKVTTISTIISKSISRSNSLLQSNAGPSTTINGGTSLINKENNKSKISKFVITGIPQTIKVDNDSENGSHLPSKEILVKDESKEDIVMKPKKNSPKLDSSKVPEQKESKKRKSNELSSFDIWHMKPDQSICYNFQTWLQSELKYNCKRFGPNVDLTPLSSLPNSITDWSAENVYQFISTLGFKEEAEVFLEKDIDGLTIMLMSRYDFLHSLPIKTGPAIRLIGVINRLHEEI